MLTGDSWQYTQLYCNTQAEDRKRKTLLLYCSKRNWADGLRAHVQLLLSVCYAVVEGDLFLHMSSLCQQDKEAVKCKTKFPVLGILSLSSKARQRGVPRRGSSYTGKKVPVFLHTICIFNRLQKNESKISSTTGTGFLT